MIETAIEVLREAGLGVEALCVEGALADGSTTQIELALGRAIALGESMLEQGDYQPQTGYTEGLIERAVVACEDAILSMGGGV